MRGEVVAVTLGSLEGLIAFCIPVGMALGAAPVLAMVFLGAAFRVFEDVASA